MSRGGVNPSIEMAKSTNLTEHYQSVMTDLESGMDELMSASSTDDPQVKEAMAELRTEISNTRAALGFWRGEESFWKNELQENKTALKEGNSLAKSS